MIIFNVNYRIEEFAVNSAGRYRAVRRQNPWAGSDRNDDKPIMFSLVGDMRQSVGVDSNAVRRRI